MTKAKTVLPVNFYFKKFKEPIYSDGRSGWYDMLSWYAQCPRCETWNLLAQWRDNGGYATGSATCDNCDFNFVMEIAAAGALEITELDQTPVAEEAEDGNV